MGGQRESHPPAIDDQRTVTYGATGGMGGKNKVGGYWKAEKHAKALGPCKNPPVPPADHTTRLLPMVRIGPTATTRADYERGSLPCPADVLERSALIEEGDGIGRDEADARALAEVGFPSWSALALAHAERIEEELSRLPPPCDATGARLLAGTRKLLTGEHWHRCVAYGWLLSDVFGLDEWALHDRKGVLGLVPRVAFFPSEGRRLVEILSDGATFREANGSLAVFRRPSLVADVAGVVAWWRSRAIVSDEAA